MMRKRPIVSVVCITYNHSKYIAQAIESFLEQQTNFDFEIVISDDASSDDTRAIIKKYAQLHPDIIKARLGKVNLGAVPNSITALKMAQGDYIALCEGDDYWTDATKLQRQFDFMKARPEYALCFHPVRQEFENNPSKNRPYPDPQEHKQFTLYGLLERNFIQTNSVFYRRLEYNDLPNDILPFDWYLHLFHARIGKIGFIDRTMSAYRIHAGGMWEPSHREPRIILERYGAQWVNMFCELRRLFPDDQKASRIIDNSLVNTIRGLSYLNSPEGKKQLELCLRNQPGAVMLWVDNMQREIENLKGHSDNQGKVIDLLNRNLEKEKQSVADLNCELASLHKRSLVKLDDMMRSHYRKLKREDNK